MKHELLSDLGQYLVEGSLSDARVLEKTGQEPPLSILPKAHVLKIGGQSFIDRGRAAVFPLIEEIVVNLGHHDMIIGTGGGSRARHAYSVGLDLGLPAGVLSVLGTFVSMQNVRMLHYWTWPTSYAKACGWRGPMAPLSFWAGCNARTTM